MSDEETYNAQFMCGNCRTRNGVMNIPKGKRLIEFLEENKVKCENCSCNLFEKEKED